MPRYFFHVKDDPDLIDKRGAELPNDAAARQEAILRATRTDHQLSVDDDLDHIVVEDESGREVCRTPPKRRPR